MAAKLISDIQSGLTYGDYKKAFMNCDEVKNNTSLMGNFDDYWNPFLGGQGPAPAYTLSLNEENRAELRECLRKILPVAEDGSIPLIARAWAVRGIR